MHPTTSLNGSHLRTYNTIFQHPVSHNLAWHDVHALMRYLGEVTEEPNGNLKVIRNGQTLVMHLHRTKDVAETEELMTLRHFLERSETIPAATAETGPHWLLLIDHHEARLFRSEMHGAVPEQIVPHQPEEYFRHATDSKSFARGEEQPDLNSYFGAVAKVLAPAGQILVFGSGTGKSSEMEQLVSWLKLHHAPLAARVIGTVVVDGHHLTNDQLLAKAREFYASHGKPVA